jgi:hypothetical protein
MAKRPKHRSVVCAAIAILTSIIFHARRRGAFFLGTARRAPAVVKMAVLAIATRGVASLEGQARCIAAEIALAFTTQRSSAGRRGTNNGNRAPASSRVSPCTRLPCAFGMHFVGYQCEVLLAESGSATVTQFGLGPCDQIHITWVTTIQFAASITVLSCFELKSPNSLAREKTPVTGAAGPGRVREETIDNHQKAEAEKSKGAPGVTAASRRRNRCSD